MFGFNINALRIVETLDVVYFRLLGKDFRMSILDFNVAMGFANLDDVKTNSYHTALSDIPSIQTSHSNRVFHQCHNFATREPEEQPPSYIEECLSRIEAHLDTMENQVSTILAILQSSHSQH
ncbi:hypothetical protein J1N35_022486 [Gossypium stocksii]|uniref:Uncharacterized protein n=1 Tax=Gossypium stocksii TaxID=47602 RepID=A0A9D3VGK1_9ROSI|nr:hypothetical protein J1N35_022486 [Gossypium stocksii]